MAKPKVMVEPFVARADLAGPTPQAEETVTIDMGHGMKRTIARGTASNRLSDELWAAAQERVKKELADKQAEQDKMAEKHAVPAVAETGKFGDVEFSESDVEAVKQMKPDVAAKFINDRIRNKAAKEEQGDVERPAKSKRQMIQENIVPNFDGTVNGKQIVSAEELETIKQMSPEAQAEFIDRRSSLHDSRDAAKSKQYRKETGVVGPKPSEPSKGGDRTMETPEGDVLELQSNAGGLDPRALGGSVANMMMGATPDPGLPTGAGGGTGVTDGQGPGANPGPYPEPSKMTGPIIDVPEWARPPPGRDYGLGIPDAVGALDKMFSPEQAPPAAPVSLATSGATPTPATPPVGSASASLGVKMPSGFRVEKPDPRFQAAADEALLKKSAAINEAQAQIAALQVTRDGAVEVAAAESRKIQEEAAKSAQLATQARQNSINEAKRYQTASLAMMERAREAASTPTDPNRYWNSKDAGQKAAGIIAGALFGFTGQGMQWLQRVDALVAQDNQLQVQDRASKVAGMREEGQALGEAGRQALALGASEAEAFLIERQTKLEGLKSYLEMMTMKTNNMDAKLRGQQMLVELAGVAAKDFQQGADLAQQNADKKTEWNYKNAVLGQNAYEASVKAGGGDLQDLKPGQQEKLSSLLTVGDEIADMAKQYKQQGSGLFSAVSQYAPMGSTDAAKWNDSSSRFTQSIGYALEGGKLSDTDKVFYKSDLIPSAGETSGAAENKSRNLIKYATTKYRNEYNTLNSAYVRSRNLPTPEQYEAQLLQKAGLSGGGVSFTPSKGK